MSLPIIELRWYGWGDAAKTYPLNHRPDAWKFLRAALDLHGDELFPVCDFDRVCADAADVGYVVELGSAFRKRLMWN